MHAFGSHRIKVIVSCVRGMLLFQKSRTRSVWPLIEHPCCLSDAQCRSVDCRFPVCSFRYSVTVYIYARIWWVKYHQYHTVIVSWLLHTSTESVSGSVSSILPFWEVSNLYYGISCMSCSIFFFFFREWIFIDVGTAVERLSFFFFWPFLKFKKEIC